MPDLRTIGFNEVRDRITGNRLEVYGALLDNGPKTGSEIAAFLKWDVTSVRPRLTELVECFHAETTGRRRNHEHEFRALTPSQALAKHAGQNAPPVPVAPVFQPAAPQLSISQTQQAFLFT